MTNQRNDHMDMGGFVPPEISNQKSYTLGAEVGTTGLRKFGYQIDEEFDPNLKGLRGVRKFDEMRRNDPDVGAILTAVEMSIRSVQWEVTPSGETPVDKEAADFLQSCMDDMSHTWEDFVVEVLTMLPFGWAYMEKVYKLRNGKKGDPKSNSDDGRIGWRKVVLRGQESLKGWVVDENGGIRGMLQYALLPPTERFIPIEKAVLFRTKREKNNPEGYSLLRNAYRPWYIKTNTEEIEVISAERDMTGVPVITLPTNASQSDKDAAMDMLRKLKSDEQAGIVLPRTGDLEHMWWGFNVVSSAGATRIDTDKIITRNVTAIARSVLAQFLTVGGGRVGSYAMVKDYRDLFQLALIGLLDVITETANRFMVEPLFELNDFPGLKKVPTLTHGRIGQRDLVKFGTFLTQMGNLGMPITNDDWKFIRDEAEMPELTDEFWAQKEVEDDKNKEAEQALKDAAVNAAQNPPEPKPTPEESNPNPTGQPNEAAATNALSETAAKAEARSWFDWIFSWSPRHE